jgi:hypothetical protein
MSRLVHQTCFNHATREAAARCPGCSRFYCRECVTEHDDVILCAGCLKKLVRQPLLQRPLVARMLHAFQCLCCGLLLWFLFYLLGDTLASLPSRFHEGSLWKVHWLER